MGTYRAWLATLTDDRKNATSPQMWTGTVLLVLLILAVTSWVQPVAGWFGLVFWTAFICFLPSATLGFVAGYWEAKGRLTLEMYGVLVLVGNTLLQFFFGALVALSSPPGSFALASLLVLTLAFHGYMTRTSLKYPFPLVGSIVALTAAISLDPSSETWSVFAFVGPTGLMVSLLTGQAGLREHDDRREREKLRQAIQYRALSEKVQAHAAMSERVVDLLRYNHDAGNTLSTVFLNAQLLDEQVQRVAIDSSGVESLQHPIKRLLAQLQHLKSLINRAHQLAEAPIVEQVRLADVLATVAAECRSLHPGTMLELSSLPSVVVNVQDGEVGLRRILENLFHNACEGDGVHGAMLVHVDVRRADTMVRVSISDNGPGFAPHQLEGFVTPFHTTKAKGSGLGLYNVSHLVQASGGTFRRSNTAMGGALVELELVQASDSVEAPDSEASLTNDPGDSSAPHSGEREVSGEHGSGLERQTVCRQATVLERPTSN